MKIKMNKVVLAGYISKVYVNDNKTMMNFSLGVDDSYYSDEKRAWVNNTNWITCKIFDKKRIENLESKLENVNVILEGALKTNNYTKNDGTKVYETYVSAGPIQIVSEGQGSNSNEEEIVMDGIDED